MSVEELTHQYIPLVSLSLVIEHDCGWEPKHMSCGAPASLIYVPHETVLMIRLIN